MKIHDVFHLNLLWPAANDPLPGQHNNPLLLIVVDDKEEWEVDNILDVKRGWGHSKKLLFWVKWKGYDKDKQWYPALDFEHTKEIVNKFYKRHLSKPRWVVKWAGKWAVDWAVNEAVNEAVKKGVEINL